MGRPESNPVKKLFFSYNIDKNESICNIEGCLRPILKGNISHNLETHIRTTHPNEATILDKAKDDIKKRKFINNRVERIDNNSHPNKKRGLLDSFITIEKRNLNVNLNKSSLLDACTEIVTVNGRPLTIFNDSGFTKILRPLTDAIGGGFTINSHNIKNHILNASNKIISSIKNDIKKQLISLKIDSVKRHNRSILGINIQYIKNNEITLKTLAMVEILDQHTAENLKQLLLDVLGKYEISLEQIYTITCDNAANMIKMARIISVNDSNDYFSSNDEINDNTVDTNEDDDDKQTDSEDEYFNDGTPISNEDIENELLIESFNFDEENMAIESFEDNVFDAISPSPITTCMRCAVHTLQLCILDGFKNTPITNCVAQARKVVKKLRTPKYANWLKRKNFKYAIIDNETRWNSVYNMLYRLLELKEFCQTHHNTNSELKLKKSEWDSIQGIVDALKPVKIATLALQKQDINLGDFYGIWLKASHGLQSNGSILAKQILKCMKEREVILLKNPVFLAAIFLDPRYQCMLNEDDKNSGINHLIKTWTFLTRIQNEENQIDNVNNSIRAIINDDSPDQSIEIPNDEDGFDFELFLSSQTSSNSLDSTCILNDISVSLHNFKEVKRLHYTTNIIEFWETQKYDKPELYKLSNVVLAVPATQVSVERSFSGIKFILSDLRTSLSANLLDAIMIVRSNTKFMK